MTTIFAVIISSVMFWPNEDVSSNSYPEQVVSSKTEVPNTIKAQISNNLGEIVEKEHKGINSKKSVNTNLDAKTQNNSSKNSNNTNQKETDPNTQQSSIVPATSINVQQPDLELDTIKPIDGSRFVLRLCNEELEKIGFQVNDSLVLYENNCNDFGYRFGKTKKRVFGQVANFTGQGQYTGYYDCIEEISFERTKYKETTESSLSFYPVFKSSKYYTDIMTNGTIGAEFFDSANDTLLPIVFPDFKNEIKTNKDENLLWFVVNNQLYDLLSEKHKPLLDEFLILKSYKEKSPQKDFILYRSPFSLDESKIMNLSDQELGKIGFSFYTDSLVYSGKKSELQIKISLSKRNTLFQKILSDCSEITELNNEPLALFVTKKDGSPLFSLDKLPNLFPSEGEFFKNIPLLVPVRVSFRGAFENLIFWFLPDENFFNSLPVKISSDLRKEYNYIMAENKSALVKPECKYFDECTNTLEISNFKAYPNPAKSNLTVSFTLPEEIDGRITLVDLSGRERQVLKPSTIYSKGKHTIELNVSNVPEGIYLLTLYSDKGIQTQRLIVTR